MKHLLTKQKTLKFDHTRIIMGLNDGSPVYAIINDAGKTLFSGTIENETPDELVDIAIEMRGILEAAK